MSRSVPGKGTESFRGEEQQAPTPPRGTRFFVLRRWEGTTVASTILTQQGVARDKVTGQGLAGQVRDLGLPPSSCRKALKLNPKVWERCDLISIL